MGKLISLVQQPMLEHPAMYLHSGDVLHGQPALSSNPQWAAFMKVQYLK